MRAPCGLAVVLALAAFALSGCGPPAPATRGLTLVAPRGPFATIQEAAGAEARVDWLDADLRDDEACTASFAATELQRFLPACLGVRPANIRLSDSLPERGDAIVLRILPNSRAEQGYRITSEGSGAGRRITIEAADRAGLLYGAYGLLERLGVRFYGLGQGGVVLPARPAGWPSGLSLDDSPAFSLRGFWAWEPRGNPEFFHWMAANRMNLWTSADAAHLPLLRKLGIRLTGGGHSLQAEYLNPHAYFAAHPEWYGLQDGRRSPNITESSGDNFCTGNEAARGRFARNIAASLASGPLRNADVLELWMLDQGRWCTCPLCRAQGSPTDRLLAVAGDVAAAVDSARRAGAITRPVEVRTLAYMETRTPPTRGVPPGVTAVFYPYFRCYVHALADPACTELNARQAADYRGWRAAAPDSRWGVCEYWNVGAFKSMPLVFSHVMASDAQWYARTGARELTYMHAPTREWGTWTLHQALSSRLAWNPAVKPDSFVAAFCREFYPGAGDEMTAFYRDLEIASANILMLQATAGVYGSATEGGRLAQARIPIFPFRHFQETKRSPATDDGPDLDEIEAAIHSARNHLWAANRQAHGVTEGRIFDVLRRFRYGQDMFALYAALIHTAAADRARDGDRARREFEEAEHAEYSLKHVSDLVHVSASHANATNGFEASGVQEPYGYFARLYGR